MASNWLLLAQIPILLLILWLFTVYTTQSLPTLQGKRIVLLIAHPDDEAMFFAPALQWLTNPALGNQVVLLCMSSGDADGLGAIRKTELRNSALQLGVALPEHVVVLEHPALPDSMTAAWDPKLIAAVLARNFAPDAARTPTTEPPRAGVDVVLTFDGRGVSAHPNHIALYHGAVAFVQALMQRHGGWESPVKVYALTTTGVLRKYVGGFDALATLLACAGRRKEKGEFPSPLLMMSGPLGLRRAQRAMTTAHKSQMRWFRWGWIGISRYMVLNDLTKVKIAGSGTSRR